MQINVFVCVSAVCIVPPSHSVEAAAEKEETILLNKKQCNRVMQLCETQMIIRMTKHPIELWYTNGQIEDSVHVHKYQVLLLFLSLSVVMSSENKKEGEGEMNVDQQDSSGSLNTSLSLTL